MASSRHSVILFEETIKGVQTTIVKHAVLDHFVVDVFLPKGHRFYGKHWNKVNDVIDTKESGLKLMYELTHGGWCDNGCWLIGFDTAHCANPEQIANETSLVNTIKELTALAWWL